MVSSYNEGGDKMGFKLNYSTALKTKTKSYEALFKKLGFLVMKHLKIKADLEVTVLVVSNAKIKSLNKKFRNINKATDVLSFPNIESNNLVSLLTKNSQLYLGDIVISNEKALTQASDYSHSQKREFSFLFVHGLLHLLGYDHINKKDEATMFKLQETILTQANIRRKQ